MTRSAEQAPNVRLDGLDTFVDRDPGPAWFDHRGHLELYARFALVFERLGPLTGQRGLEVGCGSGPYLAEAVRRGAEHVVGIDPAPGMLELAHARMEQIGQVEKVTLLEGYFPDVVPAGTFDFAIVVGVLDYVADPLAFLQALYPRVTGPAVVSFPSKHWFHTPIRRLRYRMRGCPVHFYDEQQIGALAQQAGWNRAVEIIKIDGSAADYLLCLTPSSAPGHQR